MTIPDHETRCLYNAIRSLSRDDLETYALASAVMTEQLARALAEMPNGVLAAAMPEHLLGHDTAIRMQDLSLAVLRKTQQLYQSEQSAVN